jgi:hypothetical protein
VRVDRTLVNGIATTSSAVGQRLFLVNETAEATGTPDIPAELLRRTPATGADGRPMIRVSRSFCPRAGSAGGTNLSLSRRRRLGRGWPLERLHDPLIVADRLI